MCENATEFKVKLHFDPSFTDIPSLDRFVFVAMRKTDEIFEEVFPLIDKHLEEI